MGQYFLNVAPDMQKIGNPLDTGCFYIKQNNNKKKGRKSVFLDNQCVEFSYFFLSQTVDI